MLLAADNMAVALLSIQIQVLSIENQEK